MIAAQLVGLRVETRRYLRASLTAGIWSTAQIGNIVKLDHADNTSAASNGSILKYT